MIEDMDEGFAREVRAMRLMMESELGTGADRAGRLIEQGLLRGIRSGKLGFEELKRVALSAMADIASAALQGLGGSGGLLSIGSGLVGGLMGLPGRATGGLVAPGRAYVVGERGPELFMPTSAGRIEASGAGAAAPRDIRVSITIAAPRGSETQALARSGRQVARAVRAALDMAEG